MPLRIWVHVKPLAKKQSLTLLDTDSYQAAVHAPPQDGKANRALIELLAEHFSLPKTRFKIVSGHTARKKLVQID